MIYTCTLNPSLDYYLEFNKDIVLQEVNRTDLDYFEAGGKGVNISIVLNNMKIPSRALGFLGGFNKEHYLFLLKRYEMIQPLFTYISENTRVNVKVKSQGKSTSLNAFGPHISDEAIEQLVKKVERLDDPDIFVLGGSCHNYLEPKIAEMLKMCQSNQVKVVLYSANPTFMLDNFKYKPYFINPTIKELQAIVNHPLEDDQAIIAAALKCHEMGAQNVMVVIDAHHSIFVTASGVYQAENIAVNAVDVNGIGSQDAIIAGFIMSSLRTNDILECFKYANCCQDATMFTKGNAVRLNIDKIYEQIKIKKVG